MNIGDRLFIFITAGGRHSTATAYVHTSHGERDAQPNIIVRSHSILVRIVISLPMHGAGVLRTCVLPEVASTSRTAASLIHRQSLPCQLPPQRLLPYILSYEPATATSAQLCLLCCQPEPIPGAIPARMPQFTLSPIEHFSPVLGTNG